MKKNDKPFVHEKLTNDMLVEKPEYNLQSQYKNAQAEMSLQQSKRDQIMTIYLAIFSFLVPFALSLETIDWIIKGLIFIGIGIIGILFCLIVVRYRVYKECYWLCLQALSVLTNYKQEQLKKEIIQEVYFKCIEKKGKKFIKEVKNDKGEVVKRKFAFFKFAKANAFSSETIHFTIIAFIASTIFGFGVGLMLPITTIYAVLAGAGAGLVLFVLLHQEYFMELKKVYQVLEDGLDSSFNFAYSKAWFLHFYVKLDDK